MTDELAINDQGKALADSIAKHLEGAAPGSVVQINPTNPAIPPNIASNLLEFLRRVQSTGMEAVAWVEAYQYVSQFVPQQPPGVPFNGLPGKKA